MPVPVVFGDPQVTMHSTNLYMDNPPDGWYMGQKVLAGPLYSRYSEGMPTNVPGDSLSPLPLSFAGKQLMALEDISSIPAGRCDITVSFIRPVWNESAQEFIGIKGGLGSGDEDFEASFEPIVAGQYHVYACSTFGIPFGNSTVTTQVNYGSRHIDVANISGFAVGQWVMLQNLIDGNFSIQKIKTISGNTLTFESDILMAVESNALARTVNDMQELTETVHYNISLATSVVTVFDHAATRNRYIVIEYTTTCTDYSGCDFWMIPGEHPITHVNDDYIEPYLIPPVIGSVFIGSCDAIAESYTFSESGACLGRTYTLYCIAKDMENTPNPSLARAIPFTFIPARATLVTSEVGNGRVTIRWNDVTTDGSQADGYNVVRSSGAVFNPAVSQQLNVALISGFEFTDQDGASNRVSSTLVQPPVNGNTYSYSIETARMSSLWSILTRNLRVGQSEVLQATKALHD